MSLFKGYQRKHISPRCMLKVDLKKAYDSVDLPFLRKMMLGLGFPIQFVDWVMACVTLVSYTILINGKACVPFRAKNRFKTG